MLHTALQLAAFLALAPLLLGVINRVKSLVAGRQGPPLLQLYFDLLRLLRKGAVYANVHTMTFPAGEIRGQVNAHKDKHNGNGKRGG